MQLSDVAEDLGSERVYTFRNQALASWLGHTHHLCYFDPDIQDDQLILKIRNKDVLGKPGKMLRKIFHPIWDDSTIESVQAELRENFMFGNLELHKSEDFVEVYNMDTSPNLLPQKYPNIDDSCMQGYDYVEAYESGDFEVWYLTDDDGNLHARTVVYDGERTVVYAQSDKAGNQLANEIPETRSDWVGARLLVIDDGTTGPYMDVGPQRFSYTPGDRYMYVTHDGNVDGTGHEGNFYITHQVECEYYGTMIDEDESTTVWIDEDTCETWAYHGTPWEWHGDIKINPKTYPLEDEE